MLNKELAFLIGRIILGINFLSNGIVIIPKLTAISAGMVKGFKDTLIGFAPFISAFAHVLVFTELILGILLLIGYKTKYTLVAISILMMILIFGTSMKED